MSYDHLIVGAGFAGATMARLLADVGQRVLIIDKRDHIGGNAYDYVNEHGVRVQKYGVHAFHTNSDAIWEFLSRFTEWRPYEHRVRASVEGKLVPFPINADTLGKGHWSPDLVHQYVEGVRYSLDGREPANAEEQCLKTVGRDLYERFFEGYTTKHWGRHPRELDASVTARIPIRFDREDRVFTDKYQAIPKDGYTAMFERMLDHENIKVGLYTQALDGAARLMSRIQTSNPTYENGVEQLIWTGAIDEYYAYRFGPLPYRSLTFHHQTYPGRELRQPCPQINYPALWQPFTRTIEWRHITGQECDWTTITTEFPSGEGEPYYPVPAPEARALYKRYEELARAETNVTFIGRLATYQYLNMDQVVGQAMAAFRRLNRTNPAAI
jgi:UDP-galactopyranose mutase